MQVITSSPSRAKQMVVAMHAGVMKTIARSGTTASAVLTPATMTATSE